VDIPTGIPLVYEFDADLKPLKHFYLADPAELEKKVQAVKSQGKAKK
jgi:2,3-bisphosphoglycerate-dependent phosphoglycerate mutase